MNPFGYGQFLPVFGMKILSSGCTQCHTYTLTHSGSWKRGLYYVLPSSPVVFVVVYLIASSVVGLCSSGVRPICNTKKEQVECNWIQHKTLLLLTYCTLKSQEKKEKKTIVTPYSLPHNIKECANILCVKRRKRRWLGSWLLGKCRTGEKKNVKKVAWHHLLAGAAAAVVVVGLRKNDNTLSPLFFPSWDTVWPRRRWWCRYSKKKSGERERERESPFYMCIIIHVSSSR